MADSAPTNVQADTIGSDITPQELGKLSENRCGYRKIYNHRRFIHYFGNSMDAVGLHKIVPSGTQHETMYWDEGWQTIPYDYLVASISPRKFKEMAATGSAFRVCKMGFHMTQYQPLMENVASYAGSSAIQSQFSSNPQCMILNDTERLTKDMRVFMSGQAPWTVNNHMTIAYPPSQAHGYLLRVEWDLGPTFAQSLGNELVNKWGSVNTLNDWDISLVQPMGSYSHEWTGGEEAMSRWYPFGKLPGVHGDNVRGKDYDVPVIPDQIYSRADSTGLGDIEYQALTGINMNYRDCPEPVYIKIFPFHGTEGPIHIAGLAIFDYFSEIEVKEFKYNSILTLNQKDTQAKAESWQLKRFPDWTLLRSQNAYSWNVAYKYAKGQTGSNAASTSRSHPYSGQRVTTRTSPPADSETGPDRT